MALPVPRALADVERAAIVESLKAFPGQEIIRGWLQEVGFAKIGLQNQMGGIIAILSGIKP